MNFGDVGQQLRAYRLGSGLRAEEVAARLGVSRAALYRYEKGDVIKLDTVKRLAELLQVSTLSLLGIGVEYYGRVVAFHERMRQMEESADQILQVGGAICYLTTSDEFDTALLQTGIPAGQSTQERAAARASADQLAGIIAARKRGYRARRPSVIAMLEPHLIGMLLRAEGGAPDMPPRASETLRDSARREIERIAALMESEPIGLQFGLLAQTVNGSFTLIRSREKESVAINPFRTGTLGGGEPGVAIVTSAADAFQAHQRAAETLWREALKGSAAASKLRALLAENAAG